MSLLAADGYVALCVTDEGDTRQLPLVCWRDDGTTVHGMVLYRGALHRAESIPGFRRYVHLLEEDTLVRHADVPSPSRPAPLRPAGALPRVP